MRPGFGRMPSPGFLLLWYNCPMRRFARARRAATPTAGMMNKTEERYAQHLELRRRAGEIDRWGFELYKLRLAKNLHYTPDFMVIEADGTISLHEVKGRWEEDARAKIKMAAEMFPWHRFVAVQWVKGEWVFEEFSEEAE